MTMIDRSIAKVLSANDTGDTGGHQAGILVPKEEGILAFFPELDSSLYNPRSHLRFVDEGGSYWEFAFIYYNNALFGGTRNEFRLTRMTKYIRQSGLAPGDEIILSQDRGQYRISHRRKNRSTRAAGSVLKLGTGWRIIDI